MSVVISLCDYTGNMVKPWVNAGHTAYLVDPQHAITHEDGPITKLAMTVEQAAPELGHIMRTEDVAAVFAFPPCTDLAVSGARWFERKRLADPLFQARAVAVAEQCRMIGMASGAPWMVENPVSVLSSVWGQPRHTFHPWHYSGWAPQDNYRKLTCLWTGGGFRMPPQHVAAGLGEPDDRIHKAPPGPERANFRSATPSGFAQAVFYANTRQEVAA